jgi:hypothetical protein
MNKIKGKLKLLIEFLSYNPWGIRSLYEKIIGTWEYLKFIWQHDIYREWDFMYLYSLIQFKLKRMALQLRKDDFVADSHDRYMEILQALAYLHIYEHIEDENYDHNNVDIIKEMYKQQQDAWNGFHDILKEHAQKWWS